MFKHFNPNIFILTSAKASDLLVFFPLNHSHTLLHIRTVGAEKGVRGPEIVTNTYDTWLF